MFVFRGFFCGLFLLFMSDFVFAVPMYKIFGGSVVLNPGHTSGPINSVTWKHKTDLALEWFGQDITCYRTFNGRCHLDETTGSFTITNLTLEDSGEYTPEINSVVGGTMELQVIKPVPKPTVSMDCNNEKTDCNLTCKANINTEFGRVTYEWKTGDTELSTNKELSITTENKESSFYCMLINLVSKSTSDEISNPISRGNNIAGQIIGVVIPLVVLIVLGVVAWVMYKRDPRVRAMCPFKYLSKNQDNAAPGNDQDNAALEEGQHLLEVPQTTAENNSKGKAALNGYQPANVNDDGLNNINQRVVSIEQQQDPPTEPVRDDEGESGLKSESEETEPTTEGPEKPKDSTCDPPVDTQPEHGFSQESNLDPSAGTPELSCQTGLNNINQTVVSIEQQQDPPTEPVRDDEGESGLKSESEETEPTTEGPEKPKDSTCDPPVDTQPEHGFSQESNLDPSAGTPELSCQTDSL